MRPCTLSIISAGEQVRILLSPAVPSRCSPPASSHWSLSENDKERFPKILRQLPRSTTLVAARSPSLMVFQRPSNPALRIYSPAVPQCRQRRPQLRPQPRIDRAAAQTFKLAERRFRLCAHQNQCRPKATEDLGHADLRKVVYRLRMKSSRQLTILYP